MKQDNETNEQAEQLATALGWFSIALGVSELTAPRALARMAGLPESSVPVVRALGARRFGHGISVLAAPDRQEPVWSRVVGDAVDLAVLFSALRSDESDEGRISGAIAAIAGVTAVDVFCATRLGQRRQEGRGWQGSGWQSGAQGDNRNDWMQRGVRVEQATTINKSIDEVYAFWRELRELPALHASPRIRAAALRPSRAGARRGQPACRSNGKPRSLEEREHEWIAWRSLEGADVENSGSVRFQRAPGARGTEVRVQLQYRASGRKARQGIAWLFGEEPSQQIHEDLRRVKTAARDGRDPAVGRPRPVARGSARRRSTRNQRPCRSDTNEGELLARQEKRPGRGGSGSEDSQPRAMPSSASRARRSAGRTSISTTGSSRR